MKTAIVGDLHFRGKKLSDIAGAWQKALGICEEKQVRYLLQAGDVYDHFNISSREASFGTVFHAFINPLRVWLKKDLNRQAFFIPGNHDVSGGNQKDALVALDDIPQITVAHIPDVYSYDGLHIAALPWLTKAHLTAKNPGLKAEELEKLYAEKVNQVLGYLKTEIEGYSGYKVLLGHCELQGVKVNGSFYMVGGNFCIENTVLENTNVDKFALGHIHKRQGWYIGALTQQNFGESGNDTGFEILDTETGESEFIEVDSPRYYVVPSEQYSPRLFKETDYVRIRGTELPKSGDDLFHELPANVEFEKTAESQTMTRRVEGLDPSADAVELLKVWHKEAACNVPVETLVEGLKQHVAAETHQSAIGSLKGIQKVSIENIASHKDTSIDFPKGMTAITGHNGSGKTFLLEAPFAALYGSFPSRPGSIADYMPETGTGKIEMVFSSNGETYTARREISKTAKTRQQQGYLICQGKTVAGGPAKLEQYENACRELIGDPNLVLASIFCSQNQAGDLVDAKPADRKELFHKLLGLERFGGISEDARERKAVLSGKIEAVEQEIGRIAEELQRKGEVQKGLDDTGSQLKEQTDLLEKHREKYQDVLVEKQRAEELAEKRRSILREKQQLEDELKKLTEGLEKLKTDKQEAENIVSKEAEINKSLDRLKELRRKYEEIQETKVNQANRTVEIERLKNAIAREQSNLENRRKELDEKIEMLRKQAQVLESGEFGHEQCKTCRLLSGAREAVKKIEQYEEEIDGIEIKLLEESFLTAERQKLQEMQQQNDKRIDAKELQDIQTEIRRLDYIEKLAGTIEGKKELLANIDGSIAEKKDRTQQLKERLTEIEKTPMPEINIEIIAERETEAFRAVKQMEKVVTASTEKQAALKADLERLAQLEVDGRKKADEIKADKEQIEIQVILARAFGRDGIPQLLIDAAIPQIQDILTDLLSPLEGQFNIQFATQKVLKSGKVSESLDIVVSDSMGSRDISSFSGGEQKMLRTILRLALAIFQAQRAGKKLEVFFVDEAFDALDRENAVRLLNILGKLQERFNQVFIVSHTDDLIGDLPNVVRLEKGNAGTVLQK